MLVLIWVTILNISLIPTIYENFKSMFLLSRANKNLKTSGMPVWFEQLGKLKDFEILSLYNILINWHYLKKGKYHVRWKLINVAIQFLYDYHLKWNSYSKSFILNSWTLSVFSTPGMKKLVLFNKILWVIFLCSGQYTFTTITK